MHLDARTIEFGYSLLALCLSALAAWIARSLYETSKVLAVVQRCLKDQDGRIKKNANHTLDVDRRVSRLEGRQSVSLRRNIDLTEE